MGGVNNRSPRYIIKVGKPVAGETHALQQKVITGESVDGIHNTGSTWS